jgi:hypothetical protein
MQSLAGITFLVHVGMLGAHATGFLVGLKMPAIHLESHLDSVIFLQQVNGNVHAPSSRLSESS